MIGVTVSVHEHDRDRAVPARVRFAQVTRRLILVEELQHVALRGYAFSDLVHRAVQQLGQHDVAIEEARAVLIRDAQRIAEAARDEERRRFTFAFEQRIGGDGGAHFHRADRVGGNGLIGGKSQQVPDACEGGIVIVRRVIREELVGDERAVRAARDDVGEGAAAVDPEFPARRRLCIAGHIAGILSAVG